MENGHKHEKILKSFGYYRAIYKICIALNCGVNDVMEFTDNK